VAKATMAPSLARCSFRGYPLKSDDKAAHRAVYESACEEPSDACSWIRLKLGTLRCSGGRCSYPIECNANGYRRDGLCTAGRLVQVFTDADGRALFPVRRTERARCAGCISCVCPNGPCHCGPPCGPRSEHEAGEVELYATYCIDEVVVEKATPAFCGACKEPGGPLGMYTRTRTRTIRPCTEQETNRDTCAPYPGAAGSAPTAVFFQEEAPACSETDGALPGAGGV